MSTVFVQVGQCGNQIGQQFWKQVEKDRQSGKDKSHPFIHHDNKYRSVNIDSEPKVIRHLLKDVKTSSFRESNIVVGRAGRGANWALGYHGRTGQAEDSLLQDSLDAIRQEIERCDSYSGVVLFHSLSGGTGSGLGSHLCESLRDEFPMHYLLSCTVAPHGGGESPLQHYNSLLTLAALQRSADGILLYHNDELLQQLTRRSAQLKDRDQGVSLQHMNQQICASLAGLFLPVDSLNTASGVSLGLEPWELVRAVCPMPATKFMHTSHASRAKVSWENLVNAALTPVQRYDKHGQPFSSLANLMVARGDSKGAFPASSVAIETRVRAVYRCVKWNPFPLDVWTSRRNSIGGKDVSSMTMVANSSSVVPYLQDVCTKAREMYEANAYLHWYWKHGCQQDDFEEAFRSVEEVVTSYQDAVT